MTAAILILLAIAIVAFRYLDGAEDMSSGHPARPVTLGWLMQIASSAGVGWFIGEVLPHGLMAWVWVVAGAVLAVSVVVGRRRVNRLNGRGA